MLFRTDDPMPVQTPIEMWIPLPAEIGSAAMATVICRGRVVRTEPAREDNPQAAVAATIAGYRLAHTQGDDPRRI